MDRWRQLVRISNEAGLNAITVPCGGQQFRPVMGACAMRQEAGKKFLIYLQGLPKGRLDLAAGNWFIDEILLSEWFDRANQPHAIVLKSPVVHFMARDYLLRRLYEGPKILIITGQANL